MKHISSAKLTAFSCQVSPDSLLGVSPGIYQTAMVDESGVIVTHIGKHNRSENCRIAWDVLYITTP
jgi:hypothetical protein